MIPFVFIAGYSNSGKTTVVERLVRTLTKRGHRVAAIKHAAHGYSADPPGKDSWRVLQAGADQMVLVGPDTYTIRRRCQRPPALQELIREIQNVDLILVEGFKSEPGPKIEVYRKDYSSGRLPPGSQIIAVVSDAFMDERVPCFSFEQMEELADFIVTGFLTPDNVTGA
jgi:molybdopterin-guanine dinucleotide biosynthesis protein B